MKKHLVTFLLICFALGTTLLLVVLKWKKKIIMTNFIYCGFGFMSFRVRVSFYYNLSLDFWVFVLGYFPGKIELSKSAQGCLEKMDAMECGGVLLSCHFSNYEFLAEYIACRVLNMFGAHEPLNGRFSNRFLIWLRSRKKMYVKKFQGDPWAVFQLVQNGGIFGYMFDQDVKRGSVSGTFFDRKCSYARAPIVVSERTGVPVFLSSITRKGLRSYTVDIMEIQSFDLGKVQDYFEGVVESCPVQWYGWSHRRFKSVSSAIYES
ncbi:MAG: lysophospholipid acyltransferase family protein [Fibrobacterales bacterium]